MSYMAVASSDRVRYDRAINAYHTQRDTGNPILCPAGAQNINYDEFGRGANINTLQVNRDGACGNYTYTASDHIQFENNNRPDVNRFIRLHRQYASDDATGRRMDQIPRNLYDPQNKTYHSQYYRNSEYAPLYKTALQSRIY